MIAAGTMWTDDTKGWGSVCVWSELNTERLLWKSCYRVQLFVIVDSGIWKQNFVTSVLSSVILILDSPKRMQQAFELGGATGW